MIFVTTGTQAPFDRFIKAVDEIAKDIQEDIVVQAFKSEYKPKHIQTLDFMPPDEFNRVFNEARLIISHAGMGTIISAMQKNKPIIVFPRLASLGEHRNDHQMATAMKMNELGYVYVAYDAKQLRDLLQNVELRPLHTLGDSASPELIQSISDFIKN